MPTPLFLEKLEPLAGKAWSNHKKELDFGLPILKNSCPILYFGNSKEYERSNIRIVTAALNPSGSEFIIKDGKAPDCALRFPNSNQHNLASYLESLDRYFMHNPYTSWFNNFEPFLNGLKASYYSNSSPRIPGIIYPNCVLHTDLLSTSATNPRWGELDSLVQEQISCRGISLWHDLMCVLKPHLVILAAGVKWLKYLDLCNYPVNSELQIDKLNTLSICNNNYQIPIMIVDNTRGQPFFGKTNEKKIEIGKSLHEILFPTIREED